MKQLMIVITLVTAFAGTAAAGIGEFPNPYATTQGR